MTDDIRYRETRDFEYYFRFKKLPENFEELWRMKSSARESLKEWLVAVKAGFKTAEVIANSASELIENCIKYSVINTFSSIYISVMDGFVRIETVNTASDNNKKVLTQFIEIINSQKESLASLFLKKIMDYAENITSQIGLIKIMMESRGVIRLIDNSKENDIVCLRFEMKTN